MDADIGAGGRLSRAALLRRGAALAAGAALIGPAPLRGAPRPPLGDLERATSGPLLRPGRPGYAAARRVANARYDGARPLAVLRARGVADVREAVRWSARTGVRLAARSGGHSYAGYSTADRGLVLDLGSLDGIAVAGDRRTARIGAGARLIDVYERLGARGLTVPAGSCPTVGFAGLALGGGVGLASRIFGTTCDNVAGLTIVTADGRALECDARRNADLFWACRGGGGGNVGVVTSFTVRTHRVGTAAWFFASYPWSRAAEVVRAWQAWAPHAPDPLFSICSLSTGGAGPTVSVFGQWTGDEAGLRRALRGLTRRAAPSRLRIGTSSYIDLMRRWAGCLGESPAECRRPPSDRFAAASAYARAPLPAAGVRALTAPLERRQADRGAGSGAILLDSYGGAINRVAPDATAFVHRDALFSMQVLAYWGAPSLAGRGAGWVAATRRALAPFTSGAYQNYIDPGQPDWARAYYGANLPRLRDVKRRVDPDRVFRFAQAVPS